MPISAPLPVARTSHASQPNSSRPASWWGRCKASGTVKASAPQAVSSAAATENARVTLLRSPTARATRITAPGPDAAATAPRVSTAARRGVHAEERAGTTRPSSHAPSATATKAAAAESAARSQVSRPMRRR